MSKNVPSSAAPGSASDRTSVPHAASGGGTPAAGDSGSGDTVSGNTASGGSASGAAAPSHTAAGTAQPGVPDIPPGWSEQDVTFVVGKLTVHGSYLHPPAGATAVPAAVLIAGSGPTDRNGNSPGVAGPMDPLRNIARTLASDGVASLRYDKLGSGATGMGPFAAHPESVGIAPFTDEAVGALKFLADRPGVDRHRLSIYGHSEGALFALLVATDKAAGVPPVHSLGLIEPLSKRYLDVITEQVTAQVHQQQAAGQITADIARTVLDLLRTTVTQLRTKGTVPPNLGYGLANLFNPGTLKFLREADAIDPAALARKLGSTTPVLITCSDADIQVPCSDVAHLADAVPAADLDFVRLRGVDHVLKQDDSKTAANYGKNLPFSSQLVTALRAFTRR